MPATAARPAPFTRRDAGIAAVVAIASIAVNLRALKFGFLSDDFLILSQIKKVGGLARWSEYFHLSFYDYYRPLVFLSDAVDWRQWGLWAGGFHLTNIVLHALNAALVFLLARRLDASRPAAGVAAAFFAMHPTDDE